MASGDKGVVEPVINEFVEHKKDKTTTSVTIFCQMRHLLS